MPKASGKHWENKRESKILTTEESTFEAKPKPIETKQEAATKLGFNKQQVERFQTLAANKEIVEQRTYSETIYAERTAWDTRKAHEC